MEQFLVILAMVLVAGFIGYKVYQMSKDNNTPSTGTGTGGSGTGTPTEGERPTKDFPDELKSE